MNKSILLASLLAVVALAACSKKEEIAVVPAPVAAPAPAASEVAAVVDQIPKARETAHALHRWKIQDAVLQDFVGRLGAVAHLKFLIMSDDWCAAQTL